jgi:AraC-like DNA-binding protein
LCGPARLSISEISEAIGFSASANFIRFFRNHVGLSPNRFRLSFRTVA